MNDPSGFPGQHTTTTTVTQTQVSPAIRYDPTYFKTLPGLLKIACIILNLLGFICIEISIFSNHSRGKYFNTVAMTGFWFTGIMLVLYLLHICEKFYKIPWLKIEMWFNGIWTFLYVFAASFAAAFPNSAYAAAAFFGFSAMCVYGYDAFQKFIAVRSGEIAQGTRRVQQQTSSVTVA